MDIFSLLHATIYSKDLEASNYGYTTKFNARALPVRHATFFNMIHLLIKLPVAVIICVTQFYYAHEQNIRSILN
jgi:hypothetical protein